MYDSLHELFVSNNILSLFLVIGVGFFLGRLKILGINFGVSAVLFVGIAFAALFPDVELPEFVYSFGLVLFVYTIGLHAGPTFFANLRSRGLKANLISVMVLTGSLALAGLLIIIGKQSAATIAGLFCGAHTNTPALAVVLETLPQLPAASSMQTDMLAKLGSQVVMGYSLAYPFGVLGIIIAFQLFSSLKKIDFSAEAAAAGRDFGSASEHIIVRTYAVRNPAMFGKQISDFIRIARQSSVLKILTGRIEKKTGVKLATTDTVLEENDMLTVIGDASVQEIAHGLLGAASDRCLELEQNGISSPVVFVSNKQIAGRTIQEISHMNGITISRLRRGGIEIMPTASTTLELGDQIRFIAYREDVPRLTNFFGNAITSLSETDFFSVSLGILIGIFIGLIPLPLPGGSTFKLGLAGGPLIAAIFLGKWNRTGSIRWSLPHNANLVLREIGLVLFLAGIGLRTGGNFTAVLQNNTVLPLLLIGACLTSLLALATILICYYYLKLPFAAIMGIVSAIQTQPACLAYANEKAQSDLPSLWYTIVYPTATVVKIIAAQLLISLL
ncbi:MAG TPA: TrkA C-terminal domain-containing protein [bacterium]|nr:TrkA C-terminal domain-containing protein [bacterium]